MDETTFPSASWFEHMAADVEARADVYRHLGFCDFRLVMEIVDGDSTQSFGLVLDGYDVLYAGELEEVGAFGADATLAGEVAAWREMVGNIVRNGRADGHHTLNALTIAEAPLRVSSNDPLGRDKFFRYAETLQTMFDSLGSQVAVG